MGHLRHQEAIRQLRRLFSFQLQRPSTATYLSSPPPRRRPSSNLSSSSARSHRLDLAFRRRGQRAPSAPPPSPLEVPLAVSTSLSSPLSLQPLSVKVSLASSPSPKGKTPQPQALKVFKGYLALGRSPRGGREQSRKAQTKAPPRRASPKRVACVERRGVEGVARCSGAQLELGKLGGRN